jgi:hypothetical protein
MAAAAVRAAIDEGEDSEAAVLKIVKPTIVIRRSSGPVPDGGR